MFTNSLIYFVSSLCSVHLRPIMSSTFSLLYTLIYTSCGLEICGNPLSLRLTHSLFHLSLPHYASRRFPITLEPARCCHTSRHFTRPKQKPFPFCSPSLSLQHLKTITRPSTSPSLCRQNKKGSDTHLCPLQLPSFPLLRPPPCPLLSPSPHTDPLTRSLQRV